MNKKTISVVAAVIRDGERVFIPNISAAITAMLKYNQ